jgi:hypothetical protein
MRPWVFACSQQAILALLGGESKYICDERYKIVWTHASGDPTMCTGGPCGCVSVNACSALMRRASQANWLCCTAKIIIMM